MIMYLLIHIICMLIVLLLTYKWLNEVTLADACLALFFSPIHLLAVSLLYVIENGNKIVIWRKK